MKKKSFLIVFVFSLFPFFTVFAQHNSDSVRVKNRKVKPDKLTPYHKNVIKFNPTPMLIQGMEIRNLTFSYERLFAKNMSASVQAGYLIFPEIKTGDVLGGLVNIEKGKKQGINLALDYRYYPFQRNKRPAPDGIYLGGYFSYYGFQFANDFTVDSALVKNGSLKGSLDIFNLGVQLGYQFVFWKRFTVDLLLFGPAIAYYSGNLTFSGGINEELVEQLSDELVQKLENRFPLIKTIASGEELRFTGSKTKFGIGLRYSIQLGFHF